MVRLFFISIILSSVTGYLSANFTESDFHQTVNTFIDMTDPVISRKDQDEKAQELKQKVKEMNLYLKKMNEAKEGVSRLANEPLAHASLALFGALKRKQKEIKKSGSFGSEAKDTMNLVSAYYKEIKNLLRLSIWNFSDTPSIQNSLCVFAFTNHFTMNRSACTVNSIESCIKIQSRLVRGYMQSGKEITPLLSESILMLKDQRDKLLGTHRSYPGLDAIDSVFHGDWNKHAVKFLDSYLDFISSAVLTNRLYAGTLIAHLNATLRQKNSKIDPVMLRKIARIFEDNENGYSRIWYGRFNNEALKADAAYQKGLLAFINDQKAELERKEREDLARKKAEDEKRLVEEKARLKEEEQRQKKEDVMRKKAEDESKKLAEEQEKIQKQQEYAMPLKTEEQNNLSEAPVVDKKKDL